MYATKVEQGPYVGSPARVGAMALVLMMAGNTSQGVLFGLPPPLIPGMVSHYGADGLFVAQMLFAIASLGLLVASIVSGGVIRLFGVRATLVWSSILFGVAGTVPWFTSDEVVLLGTRLVAGAGAGLMSTAATVVLAHCYAGAARSRMLGYQVTVGSLAGLASLALGAILVGPFGWHLPFVLYGLCGLVFLVSALFGTPAVPKPDAMEAGFVEAFRVVWPVCLAGLLLMMVVMMMAPNLPVILTAAGHTSPLFISALIALGSASGAVGGVVFGRIQARLGVPQTFAFGLLLFAAGMVLIGSGAGMTVVGIGIASWGLGYGLFLPHVWGCVTGLVREPLRGHTVGLLTASLFLGGFIFPAVFGFFDRMFGLEGAFEALGVLCACAAAVALLARRSRVSSGQYAASV